MRQDGRSLHAEAQEAIRRMTVQRVAEGEPMSAVMSSYGYSRTSGYPWRRAYRERGPEALKARKEPGRPRKLTAEQEAQVVALLDGKDPRAWGFESALWNRQLVAAVVEQQLGVALSPASTGRLLKRLGLTFQRPARRALERDEQAVEEWKQTVLPTLQARAKAESKDLFFLDEAGIRSDVPLARTWAMRGRRPEVKASARRQSINAIGASSPHGEFWFHTYQGRLTATLFIAFLVAFVLSRPQPVLLVLDSHPAHKARAVFDFLKLLGGRLELHFLPRYAPDVNPQEFGWAHLKTNGTSKKPLRVGESLAERVHQDLSSMKSNTPLVRSFFRAPGVGCFMNS